MNGAYYVKRLGLIWIPVELAESRFKCNTSGYNYRPILSLRRIIDDDKFATRALRMVLLFYSTHV